MSSSQEQADSVMGLEVKPPKTDEEEEPLPAPPPCPTSSTTSQNTRQTLTQTNHIEHWLNVLSIAEHQLDEATRRSDVDYVAHRLINAKLDPIPMPGWQRREAILRP